MCVLPCGSCDAGDVVEFSKGSDPSVMSFKVIRRETAAAAGAQPQLAVARSADNIQQQQGRRAKQGRRKQPEGRGGGEQQEMQEDSPTALRLSKRHKGVSTALGPKGPVAIDATPPGAWMTGWDWVN